MNCYICKKEIEKYNKELNHIKINEQVSIDICLSCIDKIFHWQKEVFAKLFPTKKMKDILNKSKDKIY